MTNKLKIGELYYDVTGNAKKLGSELDRSEKQVKGLGGAFSKLNIGSIAAMAGIALSVAALANTMKKAAGEIDRSNSIIARGTGATGDELAKLEQNFQNVAKTVPEAFETTASVVADLNTRLGLTGRNLERTSKKMLDFARVTGVEATSATRTITRLMQDWGVETNDMNGLLDKLTVASQMSGVSVDRLAETGVTFGVQLRAIGFSIDDTVALLSKFEKEGVATEKIFAGLSMAVGRLAQAGVHDIGDAFRMLSGEMEANESQAEAVRQAIELLGTRAGPDFALAVREGRFAIDDYKEALEGAEGALDRTVAESETLAESWAKLKNEMMIGLEPALQRGTEALFNIIKRFSSTNRILEEFTEKMYDSIEVQELLYQELKKVQEGTSDFTQEQVESAIAADDLSAKRAKLVKITELLKQVENGTYRESRRAQKELKAFNVDLNEYGSFLEKFRIDHKSLFATRAIEDYNQRLEENAKEYESVEDALNAILNPVADFTKEKTKSTGAVKDNTEAQREAEKAIEEARRELEGFQQTMVGFIQQSQQVSDQLRNDLAGSFDEFGKSLVQTTEEANAKIADIVIDAQDKLADLKQRMRDSEDADEKNQLRDLIREQEDILSSREGFEERQADRILAIKKRLVEAGIDAEQLGLDAILEQRSIEEQIEEKRRVASLNAIERFEEEQNLKLERLTSDFITEVTMLREKIQKQESLEDELTNFLINTNQVRQEAVDQFAQDAIAKYGEMAKQLERVISLQAQVGQVSLPNVRPPVAGFTSGTQNTNTTNNNVNANVSINSGVQGGLNADELSAILGFELNKFLR